MKFTANDFTTALPPEWEDRTMITLIAPFAPGSFAANVVITTHSVKAEERLEDFVQEQLGMLQNSLPGFELLDQRFTTVNDYSAYQQLHHFLSENGILQQVQTFIIAESVIFAITGTARIEEFERHLAAFRTVVQNFQVSEAE